MRAQLALFASGTGSNFEAIHDAILHKELDADIALLVCDKPHAKVIDKAHSRNIRTLVLNPKDYPDKQTYELVILQALQQHHVTLVVLAGYMRLIGNTLLEAYQRRIINIHPSLLPDFKGLDAVGQAMKAGVDTTGVTIHYVDAGMDTGEIIAQQAIDIRDMNTREDIETAIHQIEHMLYPKTIKQLLEVIQ